MIERPDRLQLLRFSDLVNQAPSPWLIDRVIRETSVAMMYGRRGSYKSFIALSMGGAVATGLPWHGHHVRNKGLVVYVAAEGGGGMVQRARALSDQLGVLPGAINMRFITEPIICMPDSDDMNVVIDRVREAIGWCPEGTLDEDSGFISDHPMAREWPQLIVVDTLARCLYGNENDPEDMGAFVQGIDRLKVEFNCAILILHHSGLAGDRERGHTSLGSACDTIYRLDAEDAPANGLVLSCEKMKDSREPEDLSLVWRSVTVAGRPSDDPSEDLTSVVIESELNSREERKVRILQILQENGEMTWTDWQVSSGLARTTFHNIVSELRRSGQIIKENDVFRIS